ncbi:MAG: class I SAM-dependent methyltransferase [Acidimicrobiia bacterium]
MVSLLGDVAGCRVLEIGCGAGPLTAWLVDHGATVTAMDVSPEMLRLAQQRVGGSADFRS